MSSAFGVYNEYCVGKKGVVTNVATVTTALETATTQRVGVTATGTGQVSATTIFLMKSTANSLSSKCWIWLVVLLIGILQ